MVPADPGQQAAGGAIQAVSGAEPCEECGVAVMRPLMMPSLAQSHRAADGGNDHPGNEEPEEQLPARFRTTDRAPGCRKEHIRSYLSIDKERQ